MNPIKILSLCCVLISITSEAQQIIDTSRLECQYRCYCITDTLNRNKIVRDDIMVLKIGKTSSSFYSRYLYFADSSMQTSQGQKILGKLTLDAIRQGKYQNIPGARSTMDYIYSNYPRGQITTRTSMFAEYFQYCEPLINQKWQIEDSTKNILVYNCIKAHCEFRGRNYTAWFCPKIPVNYGVWKFSGLPGLILEVYDTNKDYYFKLISIEKKETPIVFYDFKKIYNKTKRKAYLKRKAKLYFGTPSQGKNYIKASTGIELKGSPRNKKKTNYDFMEKDYR